MNDKNAIKIQKGDIFYADLGETVGSEQNGIQPGIGNPKRCR